MEAVVAGREPLEFERQAAGESVEKDTRKMPMYHIELKSGLKVSRPTKTDMDEFLATVDFEDILRIYKGHELAFKRCALVVME